MTKCPVIFDCDGVLLDWELGFQQWVEASYPQYTFTSFAPTSWDLAEWIGCTKDEAFGLIRQFNQSEAFGRLYASPHAARTLYEVKLAGHPVYALTSCSSDPAIQQRRAQNLAGLFATPFERVICLDLGVSKLETLRAFNTVFGECIWVEDNFKNATDGYTAGHQSFFLHRPHNRAHWDLEEKGFSPVKHLENLLDLVSLIK